MQALILLLALQAKPATIDELIDRLSSDLLETRAKSLGEIQARWKTWADADLAKLRKHVDSKNADLAAGAKAALSHIELRRKYEEITEEIWTAFPDLAACLDNGPPAKIGKMLQDMDARVEKGEFNARAVMPAALEFIADDRDTEIGAGYGSADREYTFRVNDLADGILRKRAPALAHLESREEAREWWRKNKGKSDREWNLDGLTHGSQGVRAASIGRLAALKDASLHSKLMEAFKTIDGEESFRAVDKSNLPAGLLLPELRRRLKDRSIDMRLLVLSAIEEVKDPTAEDILVECFDDGGQRFQAWYGRIAHPRVCDWAGLMLERRMKLELVDWPEDVRERDRKLEEIRNQWRKSRGLPPLPYLGPGVVAVAPEKVAELIPELTHESQERRTAAQRKLSQLGPGAWKHVQERIAASTPPSQAHLEEAARNWSNALRSIKAENGDAEPYVKALEPGLHLPFDFEALHKLVLAAWYEDGNLIGLEMDVVRGSDGRGITMSIKVVKAKKPGVVPKTLNISGRGSGCVLNCKRLWFDEEMRKQFREIESIRQDPGKQAGLELHMRKSGPDGERLADFDPED